MKNILISELFKTETCFNCDRWHYSCKCEYDIFLYENNEFEIVYSKNVLVNLIRCSNKYNIKILNIKNGSVLADLIIEDMLIQDLFLKVETCLVFA